MGNQLVPAILAPITAPITAGRDILQGNNVAASLATAATTIVTAPAEVVRVVTTAIPLPSEVHNAVNAAASVVTVAASLPFNVAAQTANGVVGVGSAIVRGDNVVHAVGKGVSTFTFGVGTEAVRLCNTLLAETGSVLSGKETQRRRCHSLQFAARVIVYDDSGSDGFTAPESIWQYGTTLLNIHRATHVLPIRSWEAAFNSLSDIADSSKISEIQYWGHGSEGAALVDGQAFDIHFMRQSAAFRRFVSKAPFMANGTALIWFRTCSTLHGEAGRAFAEHLSDQFTSSASVRVAGHTGLISSPHAWKHPNLVQYDPADRSIKQGGEILATDISPEFLHPIYVP